MKYALFVLMFVATTATASDWCRGFQDGYRDATGSRSAMPACPAQPAKRANEVQDDYRRGYLNGVRQGDRRQ